MTPDTVAAGDMSILYYLKFVFALGFVVTMMLLLAHVVRRYGFDRALMRAAETPVNPSTDNGETAVKTGLFGRTRGTRRLAVIEMRAIDARRRLVLVRCDDKEHLLLLGAQSDLVIEHGLTPPSGAAHAEKETAA